jgi:hypothetical protein
MEQVISQMRGSVFCIKSNGFQEKGMMLEQMADA